MNLFYNSEGMANYIEELKVLHEKLENINNEYNAVKNTKDIFINENFSNALDKLSVELELLKRRIADNYEYIKLAEAEYNRLLKIEEAAFPSDDIKNNIEHSTSSAASMKLLEFFNDAKCKKSNLPLLDLSKVTAVETMDIFKDSGGIMPAWLLKRFDTAIDHALHNQEYKKLHRSPSDYIEAINQVFNEGNCSDSKTFAFKVMDKMNAKLEFIDSERKENLLDSMGKDYGWFPMEADEIRSFADSGIPSIAVLKSQDNGEDIYLVPPLKGKSHSEISIYEVLENRLVLKDANSLKYQNKGSIKYYVHR